MVNFGHHYTPEEYAISPEMTLGLDPREITFGDVLQKAGYRTGMVGKWDMGQAHRYLPQQRGFDFFYGHGNNGIDYFTHERYGVHSMFSGNARSDADKGIYATDLFKREAIEFLKRNADQPWFLYLAFNAPHSASTFAADKSKTSKGRSRGVGVQAPKEDVRAYRAQGIADPLARYYGAMTRMDFAIGEVLSHLRTTGQLENTLVIFFSDNGGSGNGGNDPLRGHKSTMWEGGLRVPFIAAWPGRLPAGEVTDEFLTSLEIFPALLSASGTSVPTGLKLDGFDMLPILSGQKPSPRTEMFWQRRGDKAARVGKWKWVDSSLGGGLFDLSVDIGERHDLSATKHEVLAQVKGRWNDWRRDGCNRTAWSFPRLLSSYSHAHSCRTNWQSVLVALADNRPLRSSSARDDALARILRVLDRNQLPFDGPQRLLRQQYFCDDTVVICVVDRFALVIFASALDGLPKNSRIGSSRIDQNMVDQLSLHAAMFPGVKAVNRKRLSVVNRCRLHFGCGKQRAERNDLIGSHVHIAY